MMSGEEYRDTLIFVLCKIQQLDLSRLSTREKKNLTRLLKHLQSFQYLHLLEEALKEEIEKKLSLLKRKRKTTPTPNLNRLVADLRKLWSSSAGSDFNLPTEIQTLIFNYVSFETLFIARKVCKSWRDIADQIAIHCQFIPLRLHLPGYTPLAFHAWLNQPLSLRLFLTSVIGLVKSHPHAFAKSARRNNVLKCSEEIEGQWVFFLRNYLALSGVSLLAIHYLWETNEGHALSKLNQPLVSDDSSSTFVSSLLHHYYELSSLSIILSAMIAPLYQCLYGLELGKTYKTYAKDSKRYQSKIADLRFFVSEDNNDQYLNNSTTLQLLLS